VYGDGGVAGKKKTSECRGGQQCYEPVTIRLPRCAHGWPVAVLDHGSAIPLSERSQPGYLVFIQLRVALGKVFHGVVEPVLLMFHLRFKDTASQDMAVQLVSGFVESGSVVGFSWSFLAHWWLLLCSRPAVPDER
jgi:hypothetical protein